MSTKKPLLPDPKLDWPIPYDTAVKLIALSESCRLTAYYCAAGVLTIGWGETEGGIVPGEKITQRQADEMFCLALKRYTAKVKNLCTVETNVNELGALVSLSYNIGLGALAKSSVLRAHNRGNKAAAAQAFGLWNKGRKNGKGPLVPFAGLTRRRAAEAALYLTPLEDDEDDDAPLVAAPVPQAVAAPAPVARHPLSVTGGALGAVSVLNALNDVSVQASAVGTTVQSVASNAQATVTSVTAAAGTAQTVVQSAAGFAGLSPSLILSLVLAAGAVYAFVHLRKLYKAGAL